MKRIVVALLSVALFAAASAAAFAEAPATIVVFRDDTTDQSARIDTLEGAHGFASDFRYGAALKGFAARLKAHQLERVSADPEVAFVSADGIVKAVGMVPVVAGGAVGAPLVCVGPGVRTSASDCESDLAGAKTGKRIAPTSTAAGEQRRSVMRIRVVSACRDIAPHYIDLLV